MSFTFDVMALVISASAVWYTTKVVKEARWQNDIAKFEKRLAIYDSLGKFRGYVTSGPEYPENELWEFDRTAQLGEFYFPKYIADDFTRIFQIALANRSLLDNDGKASSYKISSDTMSPLETARKANIELRDECIKLSEEVRRYLSKLADH